MEGSPTVLARQGDRAAFDCRQAGRSIVWESVLIHRDLPAHEVRNRSNDLLSPPRKDQELPGAV